jgi:hypothetical protein
VNDYAKAKRYLGSLAARKLANNTYVVELTDNQVGVKLHNTVIVTFWSDGPIGLNSGGYHTVTTKARMNAVLEGTGYSIAQKRGDWWVHDVHTGRNIPYVDGMFLDGDTMRHNPARPSSRGGPPGKRPESRHSYGVPIKGYSVKRHSRRRPLEYAKNPYPRQGAEPDDAYIQLAVSDAAGIYAPREFMQGYGANVHAISTEDRDVILRGPEDEWYWEAWQTVMDNGYVAEHPNSETQWTIYQDGDVFLIRKDAPDSVWGRFE